MSDVDGLYGRLPGRLQRIVRKVADAANYDFAAMELLDGLGIEWRGGEVHEYPSRHPKGSRWSTDEAWQMLDMLKPGIIPDDVRAYIAGYMGGALEKLFDENTRLRAALAVSKSPCVYCSLPAEEWGKCESGFPGCPRADDASGCPELGAMMELEDMKRDILDPNIVHVNMLRGGIAKPSIEQIKHLYPELTEDIDRLLAWTYQAVGVMLSDLGQFGTERGNKLLDNLSKGKLVHDDILPWLSSKNAD